MNEDAGNHGGDAGVDEPDVGQTSTADLPDTGAGLATGEDVATGEDSVDENARAARDDDMASGHLGEPGGPAFARTDTDA